MGFTSAWSISAHDDSFIATLAPRLLPLIAAERDEPLARERWERWRREPLPDFRTCWKPGWSGGREADALNSFLELTAGGEHVQKMYNGLPPEYDFSLLTDVWDLVTRPAAAGAAPRTRSRARRSDSPGTAPRSRASERAPGPGLDHAHRCLSPSSGGFAAASISSNNRTKSCQRLVLRTAEDATINLGQREDHRLIARSSRAVCRRLPLIEDVRSTLPEESQAPGR